MLSCTYTASCRKISQEAAYYPFGMTIPSQSFALPNENNTYQNRYLYNGKEYQDDFGLNWYDYGARFYDPQIARWHSVDPLAEKYYSWSTYTYCLDNLIKYIDPDGRVVRLANNYAGGMENIARIAATSQGRIVLNQLIGRSEVYTLNSTFRSRGSGYNADNRGIYYVGNPWRRTVAGDGGVLTSWIAMGHEAFHAFDHSNFLFDSSNYLSRPKREISEPRAVSFANYLRSAYSLSPLREQYTLGGQQIEGDFHQFKGNEKISDFTTLGNNEDKTSYGFSFTKTTTIVESYKEYFWGSVPDKTRTETSTHFIVVSRDKDNNVSFQIYDNERDYRRATSNW
jgi:RHS repeat-associated protein